ncbi:MAG: FkbM family methyltransferase, partial [Tardiphaga sp.]
MTLTPPIQFDRASGVLQSVNLWERAMACALVVGS